MRSPLARFSSLWRHKRHLRKGRTIPPHRLLKLFEEWEEAGHDPVRVVNAAMLDDRVPDDVKLELCMALVLLRERCSR